VFFFITREIRANRGEFCFRTANSEGSHHA
jgi:hypothetical protein